MAKFYNENIHSENLLETKSFRPQRTITTDATYAMDSSSSYITTLQTTNRRVNLPNATTLSTGHSYYIANRTGTQVSARDYDGTSLITLGANSRTNFYLNDNTSTAGQWIYESNSASSLASYSIFGFYNGNAGTGRYLEIYPGEASDTAPYIIVAPLAIIAMTMGTTALNTTTVGVYKLPDATTAIASISLANESLKVLTNLYTVLAQGDRIAIKVSSGSCNKPYVTFYMTGT